jgi:diaminohydroxyphosphoribosylaminopyrimidine deaminase/5-amino-6-(5-phosphoribosylamino)uracil reductase
MITEPEYRYLSMAARLALRGHGGAEPNPLVGCVIVDGTGESIVGWGCHRRCGGPHAEVEALRRAGANAAGATVYLTLEPCNHIGRTGPCSEALIEAGVARVVYARAEPDAVAAGGAGRLREAGIDVNLNPGCRAAVEVSDPFVRRITSGLPWVVAKWAQTLDGRIATRAGESRWISNDASRRLVHLKRGRVDAILTGIGTVRSDDPMLTARGVRLRRVARRVVVDPGLDISPTCRLVTSAGVTPTVVACGEDRVNTDTDRVRALKDAGVEIIAVRRTGTELPLDTVLRELVLRYQTTHMMVEAGAGLLGRLFRDGLVNEAWVFVAPLLFGDEQALPCVRGLTVTSLTDGSPLELWNVRRRGDDVVLRYGVNPTPASPR